MLTTGEPTGSFVRHRPMSTIEFEQQLDYLCQWIEVWDNQEVRANILSSAYPRQDKLCSMFRLLSILHSLALLSVFKWRHVRVVLR